MNNMMNYIKNTMNNGGMLEIYKSTNGVAVVGAWSRDTGTMERRLKLAAVYPDGEVSPIPEDGKREQTSAKAVSDLADLDGITAQMVTEIFGEVMKKQKEIPVQADGSGKCSILRAYMELCEYVQEYEEPNKVFIRDGYGCILAKYLDSVLSKLELGLGRLELEKNFKTWGLLRANENAGHVYAYGIKVSGTTEWFFSFKLPTDEAGSEVAA